MFENTLFNRVSKACFEFVIKVLFFTLIPGHTSFNKEKLVDQDGWVTIGVHVNFRQCMHCWNHLIREIRLKFIFLQNVVKMIWYIPLLVRGVNFRNFLYLPSLIKDGPYTSLL